MNSSKTKSRNLLHALQLAERRERELFPAEDEERACSDYIWMNQQGELPALEEYIHELNASSGTAFH